MVSMITCPNGHPWHGIVTRPGSETKIAAPMNTTCRTCGAPFVVAAGTYRG